VGRLDETGLPRLLAAKETLDAGEPLAVADAAGAAAGGAVRPEPGRLVPEPCPCARRKAA
jgi:hypothetical protein